MNLLGQDHASDHQSGNHNNPKNIQDDGVNTHLLLFSLMVQFHLQDRIIHSQSHTIQGIQSYRSSKDEVFGTFERVTDREDLLLIPTYLLALTSSNLVDSIASEQPTTHQGTVLRQITICNNKQVLIGPPSIDRCINGTSCTGGRGKHSIFIALPGHITIGILLDELKGEGRASRNHSGQLGHIMASVHLSVFQLPSSGIDPTM